MKSLHALLFHTICLLPVEAAEIPPHPRLLVTEADWKMLPERMKDQAEVAAVIKTCIARADHALEEKNLTYELEGRRMLSVSRAAVERVLDLSTAWKVTSERRYFERCRSEMLSLCAFEDWHPIHHLDTAEMQAAIAIGYDWLHEDLSEADRQTISTALLEKGLKATYSEKRVLGRDNNWNQVCNGGMVLSAIALLDVAPELALSAIHEARANIPIGLSAGYPPDGAYSEGAGYWEYGTIYSILTAEAMRTGSISSAGITEHSGFLESGKYVALAYGNSGLLFNYGDNRQSTRRASASIAWMAKRNRNAAIWDTYREGFRNTDPKDADAFHALAAFWMPHPDELEEGTLPLHFVGTGKSPIAIHRTGFGKKDLFLGIKAGKAKVNHGHMDAGSFVLDFLGQRWASDLGPQKYHSLEAAGMDLFSMTEDSGRWTVFRLNQTSHNTLTYNSRPHDLDGAAKILSSSGTPVNKTVLDMAPPLGLPEGAAAKRSFVIESDSIVTVTDTLTGLKPGDTIEWHMMTPAKVIPAGKRFSLSLGGENLMLDIASLQESDRSAHPADPPPASHDYENPRHARIKLRAVADADGKIEIRTFFRKAD